MLGLPLVRCWAYEQEVVEIRAAGFWEDEQQGAGHTSSRVLGVQAPRRWEYER